MYPWLPTMFSVSIKTHQDVPACQKCVFTIYSRNGLCQVGSARPCMLSQDYCYITILEIRPFQYFSSSSLGLNILEYTISQLVLLAKIRFTTSTELVFCFSWDHTKNRSMGLMQRIKIEPNTRISLS